MGEYHMEINESKIPNTHLINIPVSLQSREIMDNFEKKFCDSKLAMEYNDHYFQKPPKLHFTILMLKLHEPEKVAAVKEAMADCDGMFEKFEMHLSGLHYMNDDPTQVN